jgi:hypothetical protein
MHAVGIDGSRGPVALVDSRCYRPRGSSGLDAGVPLAFLWKCLANASMSTRIPSVRAQDSLVRLLLQAGCTRRDLVDVLRGNGLEELSLSLPRGDSDRDDLNRGIQFLARRGALTGDLLDAVEAARGDLRDGLADLRVELELVPPSQPLLDEPALAALKRVARQAGLHRGVSHARLKHRLPLALRAASATGSDEPEQLDAWLDAANRQRVEPGDPLWMLQWLERAVDEAAEPGKAELRESLNRWRVLLPGDLRTVSLTDADRGSLQKVVQEFGILMNAAQFLDAVTTGLARTCLIRVGGLNAGTGFLVGDDLVLTNDHVLHPRLDSKVDPAGVEFVFDVRGKGDAGVRTGLRLGGADATGPDGAWLIDRSPPTEAERKIGPAPLGVETSSECLDFALLRLAEPIGAGPAPGLATRGHYDLTPGTVAYEFPAQAALMIIGHPQLERGTWGGETIPQAFAIAPESVIGCNPNRTRVHYRTNTLNGSSGSPVMTVSGRVVALHHHGTERQFNQGIPLSAIVVRPAVAAALGGGS